MNQKDFQKYLKIVSDYNANRTNRTWISDIFLGLGALSFVGSLASWLTANRENRAYRERLAIFLGLFVPTCLAAAEHLRNSDKTEKIEE